MRSDQVTQVRGYADQFLRVKSNPYDPSNRRISILVKNGNDDTPPPAIAHATVVDGGPIAAPAASNGGKAQGATAQAAAQNAKPAAGTQNARPEAGTQSAKPAAGTPNAKPAAGTGAAAAKPGLMSRFSSLLPGGKK